jgi:CheY-like chemotaxis protein/signal transduction histidine kinase
MNKVPLYIMIFTLAGLKLSAAIDISEINLNNIDTNNGDFSLWIALFALAAIGFIVMYIFSQKLTNFKKKIKNMQETNTKINQTQDQIVSNMGENIQTIAKENVSIAKKISTQAIDIKDGLNDVIDSESQLLYIATNLIEYLRIKSKKIAIANESMNLSNLLSDVAGTLKTNTKDLQLELIYDVKGNVPENFKGDTLNLSKVLVNLLLYCIEYGSDEIILKISKNKTVSKNEHFFFSILTNTKIDVTNCENIFNAKYNEKTKHYDSLGLFVSRELSSLMGGKLIVKNDNEGNLEFVFDIPSIEEKDSKVEKTVLETKKVYIVDSTYKSALVIKDILSDLKQTAKVQKKEEFLLNPPNFEDYDLLIIDEKLFTKKAVATLKNKECKVVSTKSLFRDSQEFPNSSVADLELYKPLTKKQLQELMKQLFIVKVEAQKGEDISEIEPSSLEVYKSTFSDAKGITLNSFAEFRGTNVLLAEDNFINQKVLLGVLGKSGMHISLANNGQEALNILESAEEIDIVFMDINMPIMDGYTATQRIKGDERFKNIPVIALSALASASEVENMFASGMNGYLAKPLKIKKLFSAFAMFIKDRKEDRRKRPREKKHIELLDGLNVKLGIAQASSSEIFYKEILAEFQDAYGESSKIFEKLVKDFRFEQLRILCVDIRGLSGAIGAQDMHELSTEILQRLLFKKYELIPSFVERYAYELDKLNNSIKQYLKQ